MPRTTDAPANLPKVAELADEYRAALEAFGHLLVTSSATVGVGRLTFSKHADGSMSLLCHRLDLIELLAIEMFLELNFGILSKVAAGQLTKYELAVSR